jgi:hypothetical protein
VKSLKDISMNSKFDQKMKAKGPVSEIL